ncbi:MAG: hypothetical protein ACK55Z_01110, partial [bacterium]
ARMSTAYLASNHEPHRGPLSERATPPCYTLCNRLSALRRNQVGSGKPHHMTVWTTNYGPGAKVKQAVGKAWQPLQVLDYAFGAVEVMSHAGGFEAMPQGHADHAAHL